MNCVLEEPRGLRRSYGASADADLIAKLEANNHDLFRETYTSGFAEVLDELSEVAKDCGEPNWDGYGAQPVETLTLLLARQFVMSIPPRAPLPTAGAEPDGHLTLEWYRSPDWVLSVSISPEGMLYYAAMLGPFTGKGSEALGDQFPSSLLRIIEQIYSR